MSQIKRMLVPTDFSPASDIAFEYGLDLATREGATMHVAHVLDESSFATAYPDGFYAELPGLRAQLLHEAEKRLAALADRCRSAGVQTTTEVLIGRTAPAIVEAASDWEADVIVMGTHGRSGFAHLVLGSIAERVLRTAPCPVLTVREKIQPSERADAPRQGAAAV
jgi:nucleotide-binding universal stress UspA family protein